MKIPALCVALASLVGCGGVVNGSECEGTTTGSAAVQVAVASTYARGEVVILGDCSEFECARTSAGGGCTLWQGRISTEGGTSCRVTLSYQGVPVESAVLTGTDACNYGAQKVTLGDAPR